ncbi:MAG: cell division protein FtsX [Alphaproteobacteria bacterium]|nr:cell division protein FtsX [Alphaproteobacteria bacterium]MBU1278234.1 cell division protein FtsX [Alphaproteobacteria bacterium]MBU1573309.1 cell division protein FtsX [Alphaproteobacteria bacterium]MBU1828492.1 cell division protein FtsX [Alphaproteobacteria bacterium]MBU2078761.1 cell division protein FtsX [Alphaproteobacteria bacterium]
MKTILLPFLTFSESAQGRVVPPSGFTARLTVLTAAAMAFLAVFALALSLATGRLAERWGNELARASTVRISAPEDQVDAQIKATLDVLNTTPGVASARVLSRDEEMALLEPWFGPSLPVDTLPLPALIEVIETAEGYDGEGLRLRLAGEAPGAVLDDHSRWRRPLIKAASRLRFLGYVSLILIAGVTAGMITLAANAALAANAQVIRTLRLVGATDSYIARAFERRFTLRGFTGAVIGAFFGTVAVALLPSAQLEGGFLTGLGFSGLQWFWPCVIPPLAGFVAFLATRFAALQTLRRLM